MEGVAEMGFWVCLTLDYVFFLFFCVCKFLFFFFFFFFKNSFDNSFVYNNDVKRSIIYLEVLES